MKLIANPYFWLLALCFPAVWVLLAPGGYEPHDFHHIADIYEMHQAIVSGQLPPRLGPDFYMSFGYPLFNFYYVLPFYLGSIFYTLTGSLMESFKLVFFASAVISVAGMYILLKRHFERAASFAGAILYLYTPFRAVEIYVRGAIGEAFAIALLPWVLYMLGSVIEKTTKKNVATASLVFALFLLTHNYFFMLAAPLIGVYVFILILGQKNRLKKIGALAVSSLLAMGLSSYWWLPAFSEYHLVAANTPFVMIDHFPFLKQLIVPSWGYGSSVWGPYDEISFQIGIVNLVVVAVAVLIITSLLIRKRLGDLISAKTLLSALVLVLFFGCIFMMNIRSLFIWNIVPFTNFIQFPWRILAITAFLTAFLAGFVIDKLRMKYFISVLVVLASIVLTAGYFKPSKIITRTNEEYLEHFFNNSQYSEDYLQLPDWTKKRPGSPPPSRFFAINADINETQISKTHWKAEVTAYSDTDVYANVLAFPGWAVDVDGEAVITYPGEPYGQIMFSVGSGTHLVELFWEETKLRLLADLISLGSLLGVVFLCVRKGSPRATI